MIINEIFKKYKSQNEIFEFIPVNGIEYLFPITEEVRKRIESECFENEWYLEAVINSRSDNWFVFQLLSMVDNFPISFFKRIMLILISNERFFHLGNFHIQRIYGFITVENWFHEEFLNSYSLFDKYNLLNVWKNNKYNDLVEINEKGYICLEAKANYTWKVTKYINSNEVIKDSDYERELNSIMQKRYSLILNFILNSKLNLEILIASTEILPNIQELNDDNKAKLKAVNEKIEVAQNNEFNFWIRNYHL